MNECRCFAGSRGLLSVFSCRMKMGTYLAVNARIATSVLIISSACAGGYVGAHARTPEQLHAGIVRCLKQCDGDGRFDVAHSIGACVEMHLSFTSRQPREFPSKTSNFVIAQQRRRHPIAHHRAPVRSRDAILFLSQTG